MAGSPEAHRCTVLVIDDDADVRELLRLSLSSDGYNVVTVPDGRDALQYMRAHPEICMVILDLLMPNFDGERFRTSQLRDRSLAWIPVVVVSGAADLSERARAFRARGVLPKPLDLDQVHDTLSHIGCRRAKPRKGGLYS